MLYRFRKPNSRQPCVFMRTRAGRIEIAAPGTHKPAAQPGRLGDRKNSLYLLPSFGWLGCCLVSLPIKNTQDGESNGVISPTESDRMHQNKGVKACPVGDDKSLTFRANSIN